MATISPSVEYTRDDLKHGVPFLFPTQPSEREETGGEIAARTIPAKWLENLVSDPERVVAVPVKIENAIIDGALNLRNTSFDCGLSITNCRFAGRADFSFANFKRTATFEGSTFVEGAVFREAHAELDFDISRATFAIGSEGKGSEFVDLHVDELLQASDATLVKSNFSRIDVKKSVMFKGVTFQGETRFNSAHVQHDAEFDSAEFKGKVFFDNFQVDGGISFRRRETKDDSGKTIGCDRRVTFGGEARFLSAHIRGVAQFNSSEFREMASFDGFEVDGVTQFRCDFCEKWVEEKKVVSQGPQVVFHGRADFPAAVFRSEALFQGAEFNGASSDEKNPMICADFENAQFHGGANFTSTQFRPNAEARFVGVRFERGVLFNDAKFGGKANFRAASDTRDIQFMGAEFSGEACFRDASFRLIHFRKPPEEGSDKPPAKFVADRPLDLRGVTYDRIYVNLDELLLRIKTSARQPYTHLEQTLRKVGDDEGAESVYLERRRVERERMAEDRTKSGRLRFLADWFYWRLANYGIRPYRLIGIALVILLFGTIVFSLPRALQSNEEKKAAMSPSSPQPSVCACGSLYERYERAFGVSVHQFLTVEVPVGSACVPAPRWPSFYGSFLRVAGAVLVALGLGSVTGLLRRVSP